MRIKDENAQRRATPSQSQVNMADYSYAALGRDAAQSLLRL